MSGQFVVTADPALLAEKIKVIDEATTDAITVVPNYNVAPAATIATVVSRHSEPDDEPTRWARFMLWGLVPPWIKASFGGDLYTKGSLLINWIPNFWRDRQMCTTSTCARCRRWSIVCVTMALDCSS